MTSRPEMYVLLVYGEVDATPHLFSSETKAYEAAHAVLKDTWETYAELGEYPDHLTAEEVEDVMQTKIGEWKVWVEVTPVTLDEGVSL